MKKHSDEKPDWQEQRDKIIGLGETSLRKSYYPELREKVLELERKNEELHAANEQLASSEEELRQNYEDLSAKEHDLRESEEKYRNLMENTFDAVVIHKNRVIVYANQTAVRVFGCTSASDLTGRSIFDWVHPDYRNVAADRSAGALESAQMPRHETFLHRDGTMFDVEVAAIPTIWEGSPAVQVAIRDITDRRKAEQALRESEMFYRTVFNTTGSASVIIENDTTLSRANEGFARLSGYPVSEIEGKHRWTEFVVPDDLKRMRKYHDDRRNDPANVTDTYEFRFIDREGKVKHCISYVAMIPGTTQSIASLVDISDRVAAEHALEEKNREIHAAYEDLFRNDEELRQNYEEIRTKEQKLRESEHRNETLLHAIPDMMFVISRDGVYRDFNVPDPGILALPVDQIIGKNIRDTGFGEEPAAAIMKHIGLALDTGTLQQFEYELTLPLKQRQYEARLVALNEDEVLGIVRDITERRWAEEELQRNYDELKRTEQALRSAKTHLEVIYEGSPDLIFVHASDGRIIDINENVLRAFGITREEALSADPDTMSGRDYGPDRAMGHIREAFDTGKADFEWVSMRENGEEFPVEVRLRRIESVNERGETEPRVLAIVRDISETHMAQKALEQARKKLGLLNTVIFQDIQSTIFALSAYLQLANNNRDEAKVKSYAEKEAFLIHKIVSSLSFARNYQDMGIHPPRWQGVNQVFLYAISHLDSLKVTRDIRVNHLEIFADPLLEKAFFNISENTFLHGQGATGISLHYEEADNGLLIVYSDNGIGIAADEKQKIFERGYGKNTGLGLFLTREILSITGITIQETGEEGKGVRFEMFVPKGTYRIAGMK